MAYADVKRDLLRETLFNMKTHRNMTEGGKGDVVALYLEFINSVDGSLRLSLRVNWLRLVYAAACARKYSTQR